MKQLVVEWLEEKLLELGNQYELPEDDIDELIKKAKEIEKQQMIDFLKSVVGGGINYEQCYINFKNK
jgi:hypothetical protein